MSSTSFLLLITPGSRQRILVSKQDSLKSIEWEILSRLRWRRIPVTHSVRLYSCPTTDSVHTENDSTSDIRPLKPIIKLYRQVSCMWLTYRRYSVCDPRVSFLSGPGEVIISYASVSSVRCCNHLSNLH